MVFDLLIFLAFTEESVSTPINQVKLIPQANRKVAKTDWSVERPSRNSGITHLIFIAIPKIGIDYDNIFKWMNDRQWLTL